MADHSLTFVVPCYNVAAYIGDFLASLDDQGAPLGALAIVFVDDGSTDDTARIVEQWLERSRCVGELVKQSNLGAAAARNAGLARVQSRWVSFPDPDDVLEPDYLTNLFDFMDSSLSDSVDLIATNLLILDEATGNVANTHPLRQKFQSGTRVSSLLDDPRLFQLSAATALVRVSAIREAGLSFDPAIRPNFEDAAFLARLLLSSAEPVVAVLPSARYRYRKRADGTSLVQGSWADPEKYERVLRCGLLALFEECRARGVAVPRWIEYLAIYELQYYLRTDEHTRSGTASLSAEVAETANANIAAVLQHVSGEALLEYDASAMHRWIRMALIARKSGALPPTPALVGPRDRKQGLIRVRYEFCGVRPRERFCSGAQELLPAHAKDRALSHLGRVSYFERIVWLPDPGGRLSVELEGRAVQVLTARRFPWPWPTSQATERATATPRTSRASQVARGQYKLRRVVERLLRVRRRFGALSRTRLEHSVRKLVVGCLRRGPIGRRFRGAWVLCDRDVQAQDNAEHLYRHLVSSRPDVNVWFALSGASPDYERLKREGFRLLPYGGLLHRVALINADRLVSSQIDHYIVKPLPRKWQVFARWRFVFLQHGVTKDDLSRWLNSKDISLCIATTPDEYRAFIADGTPYRLTSHEVALTGQPRHDRLVRLAGSVVRRNILFMPTWRRDLMGANVTGGNLRELREAFWTSDFYSRWLALVSSSELQVVAERMGVGIAVMPHPNFDPYLNASSFPSHVEVLTYGEADVQIQLAQAALVVTDYSSNAFEAAIAGSGVLYYQFDATKFFAGGHVYRKGYFDYSRDGFGPVVEDLESAVESIVSFIKGGFAMDSKYKERAQAAFGSCDGRSCEKVVAAIEKLD